MRRITVFSEEEIRKLAAGQEVTSKEEGLTVIYMSERCFKDRAVRMSLEKHPYVVDDDDDDDAEGARVGY